MSTSTFWIGIGAAGQALFFARFVFQWLASERKRTIVIPAEFWLFSILGGMTLLAYAIYRRDPVFIVGHVGGLLIYGRNLMLLAARRRRINMRPRRAARPAPARRQAVGASSTRRAPAARRESHGQGEDD
jgi:lipid-A-disaccharide synthase-like uncharacterized protein